MLDVQALGARRGDLQLFAGLSFRVDRGHVLSVSGPNGSGKTTLLRTLAGLTAPASGSILWDGRPVQPFSPVLRTTVTYLGHPHALKDDMTAAENLASLLALADEPATAGDIADALAKVALEASSSLPARVLSQGQRRRIGLARLVMTRRPLWILDEPATALDDAGVALLLETLARHLERGGIAVCATHQALDFPAARRQALSLAASPA
jgi:heme exporter protein A